MSDQSWPNALIEREWFALRWHMQGFLGLRRWTNNEATVSTLTITSAR